MKENKNGFTLLELLVVVIIIGILAGIALPQYKLAVARSRLSNILSLFASIKQAQEVYYMMHNEYTNYAEDLDLDLSYCERAKDNKKILICDKYFMIDLLDGGKKGWLRAAYCPNKISGDKNFNECAYTVSDYIYTLNYANTTSDRKYPHCTYVKTNLGRKVCQSFSFPAYAY